MRISRHFVDIGDRRVHYRRAGTGPPLLMVHQSPRSSAEFDPLMRDWGRYFTCLAPDTAGFGQSAPLTAPDATIDDFATALVEVIDALGTGPVAAYGFHSGGVILMAALRRYPGHFRALAIGGYALWTDAERAAFADDYLPPFRPQAYGEHLAWLWNRVLEQSWFFPWFDTQPQTRMAVAHDDPERVEATVRDLLAAGDAYRVGYGAVMRAPRDIPPPDTATPPVLITAYDGDPLQAHLARLGPLPAGWEARPVETRDDHHAISGDFLRRFAAGAPPTPVEAADEGFLAVDTDGFDGLIHWRGRRGARLTCPPPAGSTETADAPLAIDPPGHGLSDDWPDAPTTWPAWRRVLTRAAEALAAPGLDVAPLPIGDPARLYPDLAPDRFGTHLQRAWQIARARVLFAPWYQASAASALPFDPAALDPATLAIAHRALLRGRCARSYHRALASAEGDRPWE